MSPATYKSSVLLCHDPDDEDCMTCRFLSGDQTQEVLLSVIANLDAVLFKDEKFIKVLTESGLT